jgi:Exonuclease
VEIGVVDGAGAVLFQSLINPGMPIPSAASAVHGMTDDMVRDAPAVDAVAAALRALLIADGEAVIYNAEFDCRFFASRFCDGISVTCAMLRHRDESGGRTSWVTRRGMSGMCGVEARIARWPMRWRVGRCGGRWRSDLTRVSRWETSVRTRHRPLPQPPPSRGGGEAFHGHDDDATSSIVAPPRRTKATRRR